MLVSGIFFLLLKNASMANATSEKLASRGNSRPNCRLLYIPYGQVLLRGLESYCITGNIVRKQRNNFIKYSKTSILLNKYNKYQEISKTNHR